MKLFQLIQIKEPKLASRITGMILELDNMILLDLLQNEQRLQKKINDAKYALNVHVNETKNEETDEVNVTTTGNKNCKNYELTQGLEEAIQKTINGNFSMEEQFSFDEKRMNDQIKDIHSFKKMTAEKKNEYLYKNVRRKLQPYYPRQVNIDEIVQFFMEYDNEKILASLNDEDYFTSLLAEMNGNQNLGID